MNPGLTEEAGQTARAGISALGGSPMMLALVLLQVLTMGAVLYNSLDRQRANTQRTTELVQLLDKCIAGHINEPKP